AAPARRRAASCPPRQADDSRARWCTLCTPRPASTAPRSRSPARAPAPRQRGSTRWGGARAAAWLRLSLHGLRRRLRAHAEVVAAAVIAGKIPPHVRVVL